MDAGKRILIVEDRGIVAAKIKCELEHAGFAIAGMAASQNVAIDLASRLPIHAAILDIDLQGLPVYPVAEILKRRGVPFVFLTGYSRAALPAMWQHARLVEKPFQAHALLDALRGALTGIRSTPVRPRAVTPAIRQAWDRVRHTRDILTEQRAWAEQHGFQLKPG